MEVIIVYAALIAIALYALFINRRDDKRERKTARQTSL